MSEPTTTDRGASATANDRLRRMIMGYIVSQAIFAVTEAGVVDELAGGPRDVATLAARTGVDPDALHRFLRLLAAEGLLTQAPAGTFALTDLGALLRGDAVGSLRNLVELMSGPAYQAWSAAGHCLRTGRAAFDEVFGAPMFAWLAAHPDEDASFNRAQAGLVRLRLEPLLHHDWTGVATVVDVGGGDGELVRALLAEQPHLSATVFDQPHVAASAALAIAEARLAERCRCAGGDFFDSVPPGADVYVLAQVLHDWNDAKATEILRNCRRAMPGWARLLILELVLPERAVPDPALLLDLHMLALLGGKERTESDWRRLLHGAGFDLLGVTRFPRAALLEARVVAR